MRRFLSGLAFITLLRNPMSRSEVPGAPAATRKKKGGLTPLSLAHWAGLAAVAIACLLGMIHWRLALITLSTYALMCALAPFFPRIGFFAPVVYRGNSGSKAVALTFDDGPDPLSTLALLELLKDHRIPATFFVSGYKVAQYPRLVNAIIRQGHTIGNHSYHHDPLVYFKGRRAVREEIESTQKVLKPFGVIPRVYRPPVGIVGPGQLQPLREAGLRVVNFSCRAFDRGNKRIPGMAARILGRVRSDDIILLHDCMPLGKSGRRAWLKEMEILLRGLNRRGLSVRPLQELIGRPVMNFTEYPSKGINGIS
jgi:peptidoglycan-N-acetylglucosamine deacetylase